MISSSFNAITPQYHREHKDYDFVKLQKGELKFVMQEGDVYVCNQTCFADWLYLFHNYSPIFTQIVIVKGAKANKVGLRKMGTWETIKAAMGISFPEEYEEGKQPAGVYFSVKELRENDGFLWYNPTRPVVIFPEGTKTNGLGILNIEDGVIKLIDDAAHPDSNLRVHAIRFDHSF